MHEEDDEEYTFDVMERLTTPRPDKNAIIEEEDDADILANEEIREIDDSEEMKETEPVNLAENYEKPKDDLSFPWWCRIIAIVMSYITMLVSMFFIIVKGLEFGDAKVTKWVTSLVISFLTSVFLTQPIQAVGVAIILSFIFRKYNEDLTEDKDDDGKSLNDYTRWQKFAHKEKTSYKFTSDHHHNLSQLTTKQLKEARIKRVHEIKVFRYG